MGRDNDINFAVPLKVLKSSSFTGITMSHRLSKLRDFKPAFSVLPPAKHKSGKLLNAGGAIGIRGKHLDVPDSSEIWQLVKCQFGLLPLSERSESID
jgi:hypothetical protein